MNKRFFLKTMRAKCELYYGLLSLAPREYFYDIYSRLVILLLSFIGADNFSTDFHTLPIWVTAIQDLKRKLFTGIN